MANMRLYRRTEAGKAAWLRQDPRVPLEYRRVLGLIDEAEVHADGLRTLLARHTVVGLEHLLEELVEQGLLNARAAEPHHDLDFTGELDFSGSHKFRR